MFESLVLKVVPVILRTRESVTEILLFHHPKARDQIVKGTVEDCESLEVAVLRELREESGIRDAGISRKLGDVKFPSIGQHWHFYLIDVQHELEDRWTFFTKDDGGLEFSFFWQDFTRKIETDWPETFDVAREFIVKKTRGGT